MPETTEPEVVADDSPLSWLRAKHDEAKAAQEKTVKVPGVPLSITIKPLPYRDLRRMAARALGAPEDRRAEAELNMWAAATAAATPRWTGHHPGGDFTPTQVQVGEAFGLPATAPGADVVRAVCLTDGDVKSLFDEVEKHSGFAGRQADEDFAGE